jgi:phosphate/sulfate permease
LKLGGEVPSDDRLREFMLSMVCVLIGSGLWICIATILSLPVSTTHSIVGSVIGIGVYVSGWKAVDWANLGKIALSWIASPIVGMIICGVTWFLLKRFIVKETFNESIDTSRMVKALPLLAGFTAGILALFIIYKGLSPLDIEVPIYIAAPSALAFTIVFTLLIWKLIIPFIKRRINSTIEEMISETNDKGWEMKKRRIQRKKGVYYKAEKPVQIIKSYFDRVGDGPVLSEDDQQNLLNNDSAAQVDLDGTSEVNLSSTATHEQEIKEQDRKRFIESSRQKLTEKGTFNFLVIVTSCCVATAHGANDISNAAGPLSAVYYSYKTSKLPTAATSTEIWITLSTATALVLGLTVLGYRVMKTIGKKITKLTPARAFVAQLGSATITLTCSVLGLPLSTTHIIVGSVYGISIVDVKSIKDLKWKMLSGIILSWVITIPAAAIFSLLSFFLLKWGL